MLMLDDAPLIMPNSTLAFFSFKFSSDFTEEGGPGSGGVQRRLQSAKVAKLLPFPPQPPV